MFEPRGNASKCYQVANLGPASLVTAGVQTWGAEEFGPSGTKFGDYLSRLASFHVSLGRNNETTHGSRMNACTRNIVPYALREPFGHSVHQCSRGKQSTEQSGPIRDRTYVVESPVPLWGLRVTRWDRLYGRRSSPGDFDWSLGQ